MSADPWVDGQMAVLGLVSRATPTKPKPTMHHIVAGDTLSQIAASNGTTVAKLMKLNPHIKDADKIAAGDAINLVPHGGAYRKGAKGGSGEARVAKGQAGGGRWTTSSGSPAGGTRQMSGKPGSAQPGQHKTITQLLREREVPPRTVATELAALSRLSEQAAQERIASLRKLPLRKQPLAGPPASWAKRAGLAPEPRGKPGGPGLYGIKGAGHSAYFQHIVNDLIEGGTPASRAYSLAWGILRNFAAGHDGKGNRVSAETQAKAVAALAEETKRRAEAKATRSTAMATDYDADGLDGSWDGDLDGLDVEGLSLADLDEAAREDEQFAGWAVPGDVQRLAKLGSGARFAALKDRLAGKGIKDPGALAAKIGRAKFGKGKFQALAHAARRKKAGAPAMASRREMFRFWPLEECRILSRSDGVEFESGRVVEAYAAVFGQSAEIKDHEGHYIEDIEDYAFNDVLRAIHPDRNGGYWNAVCLYNHGMTVHGTAAERFSLPAGLPRHISAEGKGLLTRTEYANTPLGEELLELVNMGALRAQSFTGGIVRSSPPLRGPGDRYGMSGGQLQRVRRLQLGLREYGLTPFAAYSGAEVLGVRMQLPGSPDDDGELWEEYPEDAAAPADDSGGHGGPPGEGSASRSTSNRLYRLRTQEALERAGITLPEAGREE